MLDILTRSRPLEYHSPANVLGCNARSKDLPRGANFGVPADFRRSGR
jgi:hypothetical protein